jgi:gliding motility-associated-like protein
LPLVLEGIFPGDYSLQVSDNTGCAQAQNLSVAEGPNPVVELGADLNATLGDSLFLNPSINFAYDSLVWTPAEAVSCDGCLNPAVTATESVTVSLLAFDLQGCEAEDDVRILVDRRSSVYSPSVFSPNDDGRNDFFTLFADPGQVANIRRLAIFDRWGNQVFEGTNLTPNAEPQGWDGRYKGEPMDPAVFAFFAEVELADSSVELIEGEVTLLR